MATNLDIPLSKLVSWKGTLKDIKLHDQLVNYSMIRGLPHIPILPEQYIGIEIEVERTSGSSIHEYIPENWVATTDDGSLRNNGREYITCPHQIKYTSDLLANIYYRLPNKREFSPRTSAHVHFNVRDMSVGQVLTVLYSYIVIEKLLYQYVGRGREKSIFCVPLQDTNLVLNIQDNFTSMKGFNWLKYTGLNLLPIIDKGTIEFRHLYGTDHYEEILTWIDIISCLFAYAKSTPPDIAHQELIQLNSSSDYGLFLEKTFKDFSRIFLTMEKYEKAMEKGVSYLKSKVFRNEFFYTLREKTASCDLFRRIDEDKPQAKSVRYKVNGPTIEQLVAHQANIITGGGGGAGTIGNWQTNATTPQWPELFATTTQG